MTLIHKNSEAHRFERLAATYPSNCIRFLINQEIKYGVSAAVAMKFCLFENQLSFVQELSTELE